MAEELLGPVFEIHGGGLDLVFPHHENELAQSRALGHEFAQIWTHNGMLRFTGEKMSKSLGNVVTLRDALDDVGPRDAARLLPDRPLAQADRLLRRDARRRRRRGPSASARCSATPSEPAPDGAWERFAAALDDDFNTPDALAVIHEWRDHELLRRALDVFGLESLAEQRGGAARRSSSSPRARRGARGERDFDEADRLRGEIEAAGLGGARRPATASGSSRGRDARAGLRPARRPRGAARPPRGARALGDRARGRGRAVAPRRRRARVHVKPERELTEARGTRDHQGVVACVEPYRYADAYELAAAERPLLVCLDQVTDPRNLGAVVRSAEGAGATGVVVPAHGSARVTPAVARASAGAVEHLPSPSCTNLARYLGEVKGAELWVVRRGRRRGDADVGGRSRRRRSRSSSARRGRGCGRSCAGRATRSSRSRSRAGRVAERQRRGRASSLYEARRQRHG